VDPEEYFGTKQVVPSEEFSMTVRGFSMVELMMAIVVMGATTGMSYPLLSHVISAQDVQSASNAIVTMQATARAAAIRRGSTVVMDIAGGKIVIRSNDPVTGVPDTVGTVEDIAARYGVSVLTSRDSLRFDPRGLGTELSTTVVYVWNAAHADTLQISRLGRVLR
jgi:prepilin-type N-terminal cleavage/methylation domain-containing protein